MPKVSICIPTYNNANYLPRTIESVLGQEYSDYELVICDDGSTDETPEVCRRYDDARIRYIRLPGKSGQAGNFNRCLKEARGEFVTLLHSDDYFLPGFLQDRVSRLEQDAELGFVFGSVQLVDADSKEISVSERWAEDQQFKKGELLEPLLYGCIVCPPSLMVRKSCVEKVGLFRTDLTWGHDWEWDLRLAEHCAATYAAQPLAAYRVHDASGTAEQLNAAKNGPQERRILEETMARLVAADEKFNKLRQPVFRALSRRHMYFAGQALLEQNRRSTRHNLRYAVRSDSWLLTRPTFWALWLGCVTPGAWYSRYQRLRASVEGADVR